MAHLSQIKVGSTTYDIDTNVTQENGTWNYEGRVLLSWNGHDTTETTKVAKSTNFRANPSTGRLRSTYFNVADHVDMKYNTTTQALDFIFS